MNTELQSFLDSLSDKALLDAIKATYEDGTPKHEERELATLVKEARRRFGNCF